MTETVIVELVESGEPIECPACGVSFDPGPIACPVCGAPLPKTHEGMVIAGKYRIGPLLGRGGMGVVHRGKRIGADGQAAGGGDVAVKFLLGQWADRPELRARFQREADILGRLHHRGIVAAEAFGELPQSQGGDLYLVMELVDGKLLSTQVNVGGRTMPIERVVRIVDQILDVLEVGHAQGIVHRDLKPENVMVIGVGADEHVKIFDFGLALVPDHEVAKRLTETYAVHGTPFYMSPEQCRGRDVGPPTDIYAVGAMLFELLAGAPPFEADNMATLLVQQMFVEPPPIHARGVGNDVPPALEAIARRALAKKAEDRFTATQMRQALAAAMRGDDEVSRDARAAQARVRDATSTRADRAIPAVASTSQTIVRPDSGASPTSPPGSSTVVHVRAWLWGFDEARAIALRTLLGAHGIAGDAHRAREMPTLGEDPPSVILLAAADDAVARAERCKAVPALAKIPLLVVDLPRAEELPKLIRAGASDVSMAGAADDALIQKVRRLLRRRR